MFPDHTHIVRVTIFLYHNALNPLQSLTSFPAPTYNSVIRIQDQSTFQVLINLPEYQPNAPFRVQDISKRLGLGLLLYVNHLNIQEVDKNSKYYVSQSAFIAWDNQDDCHEKNVAQDMLTAPGTSKHTVYF